jgi:hypothetical protein
MRRLLRYWLVGVPGWLLLLASLPGCGMEEERPKRRPPSDEEKPLVEFKTDNYGTITGRVVLEEGMPLPQPGQLAMGEQTSACHADSPPPDSPFKMTDADWKYSPQWIVGPDRGVRYAVVFLQPPDGQYFYVAPELRKPANVSLNQPHCAFFPHVFVLFPSFFNGTTGMEEPTNQNLIIHSSPTVPHNYAIEGAGSPVNTSLPAGGKDGIVPARKATVQPQIMTVRCNIHGWMLAKGMVLNHPYAAVTNEKGEFKIENAPLGKELRIVAWHEAAVPSSFFLKGAEDGDPITLTANQALTFKVKNK